MIEAAIAPLTWVDVARRLSAISPCIDKELPNLSSIRVNYFGIVLVAAKELDLSEVIAWLSKIFPGRINRDPLSIQLDGPDFASNIMIDIDVADDIASYKPNFGIVEGVIHTRGQSLSVAPERRVPVVPVLSIKGGTGRTTTATALALHWASVAAKPCLLVDADLEAPGISYLLEGAVSELKIALEDLVVLAHSEASADAHETVRFVATKLKEQSLSGNLYVLPLRRDLDELASSAVRPEHLSTPDRPFALADLLSNVAEELGCCGAVVDVRAGLMPIGVNLALDPNTFPVIVTTLSNQALKATRSFISFINREIRRGGNIPKKPLLVVNRVPTLFQQTGMDKRLIEPLLSDITDSLLQDASQPIGADESVFSDTSALEPVSLVVISEFPDLQVSIAEWSGYTTQLKNSGFTSQAASALNDWIHKYVTNQLDGQPDAQHVAISSSENVDAQRQRLAKFSDDLIAAENIQGQVSKPLVTHPLSALATRFQSDVPIAVIEGAKGTGKTLAARYLIDQKTWTNAVKQLSANTGAISALIIPISASIQVSGKYLAQVDSARNEASAALGLGTPANVAKTTQLLRERLSKQPNEADWAHYWLDVTAWSCGYEVDQEGSGEAFTEFLRKRGVSAVALFEGLEELYDSTEQSGVTAMMRGLLVALPQRLRSELKRPLGSLIFARRDTVELSVTQNLDQFRKEYASFALTWTADDVLELAAWLATQADCLPTLWDPSFSQRSQTDKAERLAYLWGTKLGPDDSPGKRSREAYTHNWIIAVLSDLQGRLVPRDLIRLLASASNFSVEDQDKNSYRNRILLPKSLKRAIEPTSASKVRETEEEIKELQPIFKKFREKSDQVSAPLDRISLDALDLQSSEIDALERHGVVFGEKAPYEVPELFRRGLGLKHSGARYSVVNLYKKARQKVR